MARRSWTLMIVPHGSESPRSFSVSERAVRAAGSIAASVGLIALIGIGMLITQLGGAVNLSVARQNRVVSAELADLRERLSELQDTIGVIGRRDEQIRLLAGLPSIEADVREAGIGGPGSPTLENDPLYQRDPALGRLAFGARTDIDGLLRRASILASSFAEISDTLERNTERLEATPSIMPTAGWLSSAFSRARRHPILHINRPHHGIDISAPIGTPIIAPAAGRVSKVRREISYGLILEIDHGNGIVTRYAHTSKIDVRVGQRVVRGEAVARVGNSGLSSGPHLHYEIHVNGKPVDPLTYVLPDVIPD
jgi:murein DD-endopeptidase MepM/ murein hydrolase activator NlpD